MAPGLDLFLLFSMVIIFWFDIKESNGCMTGKDRAARDLTTRLKKGKKKKQSPPPLKNVKSREPPKH